MTTAAPATRLPRACRCIQAVTGDGRVKAEVVTLPDGEQHKNLEVLQKVWDKALECRCGGLAGAGGPAQAHVCKHAGRSQGCVEGHAWERPRQQDPSMYGATEVAGAGRLHPPAAQECPF